MAVEEEAVIAVEEEAVMAVAVAAVAVAEAVMAVAERRQAVATGAAVVATGAAAATGAAVVATGAAAATGAADNRTVPRIIAARLPTAIGRGATPTIAGRATIIPTAMEADTSARTIRTMATGIAATGTIIGFIPGIMAPSAGGRSDSSAALWFGTRPGIGATTPITIPIARRWLWWTTRASTTRNR